MPDLAKTLIQKIDDNEIDISALLDTVFNPKDNIQERNIDVMKENIKKNIKAKPYTIPQKILGILNIGIDTLLGITIVAPEIFNVFGCTLSTDVDVAVLVDDPKIIELYRSGHVKLNLEKIMTSLSLIGYAEKQCDINLITIQEDGNIGVALKGSKETQNIIYHTYQYHRQKYPLFFKITVEIDLYDKIRSLCKFVVDNLKDIIGKSEYKEERVRKQEIYNDSEKRMEYIVDIIKQIKCETCDKSILKAIVMILAQIILLENNQYCLQNIVFLLS